MKESHRTGIVATGLALFSMIFGAGNIIFPVLLGNYSGDHTPFALIGFLIASILVPFLGLIAMMLYGGDYRAFFGRLGEKPGMILFTLLIALLGPFGSIPRLITVTFGTLNIYLPHMSLATFSFISCILIFLSTYKKSRVISLLGIVLSPILLLSLALIIILGVVDHPEALASTQTPGNCFSEGLHQGYNLLDLVAAFLYSTVILANFQGARDKSGTLLDRAAVIKKTLISMLIAAVLLSVTYVGLAYVGAFHGPYVDPNTQPEEIVRAVSLNLLGPSGGIVACIAVGLACFTTAISNVMVCSNFIQKEYLKDKGGYFLPMTITLTIAFIFSNLGFGGIANMIGPILTVLTPALIVLCTLNILHKMYEVRPIRAPFIAAGVLSVVSYYGLF